MQPRPYQVFQETTQEKKKKPHTQRKASMGVLESGHGLRHGLLFQNAMDSVKWVLAYNL